MSENQSLIDQLRRTRGDFEAEAAWHKFLLDAVFGTGGFRGRYAPTDVSVLGWAANAYARYASPGGSVGQRYSYLDQFERESDEKFATRVNIASYRNYVGPIAQLIVSYINERPMIRTDESKQSREWRENCDGNGTSWDTMLAEDIRPRAARLGYCPVLLDMPDTFAGLGEVTQQDIDREKVRPRAIPLYPINLLDWRTNEKCDIVAAKIRTDHSVGGDLLELPVQEEHYALWYPDRVERYVVRKLSSGGDSVEGPVVVEHTFGRVPLFIFRGEPTPGEKVRGRSIVSDMAVEARTHFNLGSEKRDHERGQVFAILGIPVRTLKDDVGALITGNNSAIKVPMESTQPLHYVAPPASVAETLDNSLDTSVKEMYRISRIEYDEPTGKDASGVARAYRFRQTNSRLRDLAGGWARAEQEVLRTVDAVSGNEESQATVTEAGDYSIEDLATDITNALSVMEMPVGKTARAEITKRTVRKVAPNLPREVLAEIEDEIDQEALQSEQDEAMAREAQRAALDAEPDPAKADPNVPKEEAA